jgi:hypothetical protein
MTIYWVKPMHFSYEPVKATLLYRCEDGQLLVKSIDTNHHFLIRRSDILSDQEVAIRKRIESIQARIAPSLKLLEELKQDLKELQCKST